MAANPQLISLEGNGAKKMLSTLKMPKVGEAIDEVVVREIRVERGTTVSKGDTLFVVETDKAQVEVPAPTAGVISNILIAVGDDVKTGAPTIVLDLK
jgi:pyruvate/2-oxoglutarate dehydrogenase complex dihydrolipoamide acyltransferase (E2) component